MENNNTVVAKYRCLWLHYCYLQYLIFEAITLLLVPTTFCGDIENVYDKICKYSYNRSKNYKKYTNSIVQSTIT